MGWIRKVRPERARIRLMDVVGVKGDRDALRSPDVVDGGGRDLGLDVHNDDLGGSVAPALDEADEREVAGGEDRGDLAGLRDLEIGRGDDVARDRVQRLGLHDLAVAGPGRRGHDRADAARGGLLDGGAEAVDLDNERVGPRRRRVLHRDLERARVGTGDVAVVGGCLAVRRLRVVVVRREGGGCSSFFFIFFFFFFFYWRII